MAPGENLISMQSQDTCIERCYKPGAVLHTIPWDHPTPLCVVHGIASVSIGEEAQDLRTVPGITVPFEVEPEPRFPDSELHSFVSASER